MTWNPDLYKWYRFSWTSAVKTDWLFTREHQNQKVLHRALFPPLPVRTGRYSRWTQTFIYPRWQRRYHRLEWHKRGDLQTSLSPDHGWVNFLAAQSQSKERPPADWVVIEVGTTDWQREWLGYRVHPEVSWSVFPTSLGSSVSDLQCSIVLTSLRFCTRRKDISKAQEEGQANFSFLFKSFLIWFWKGFQSVV